MSEEKKFLEIFRELLDGMNLTILAVQANVSRVQLSKVFNGRGGLSIRMALKLEYAFKKKGRTDFDAEDLLYLQLEEQLDSEKEIRESIHKLTGKA